MTVQGALVRPPHNTCSAKVRDKELLFRKRTEVRRGSFCQGTIGMGPL